MFGSSLKACEPIFRATEKAAFSVLLSPMPRYWTKSCCEEVDHAPNRMEEGFDQYLFSGLDGLRRHCKDFLFLHRFRNTSVLNSTHLMVEASAGAVTLDESVESLRDTWGEDPVHPVTLCYNNMATKLLEWLESKKVTATSASASTDPGMRPPKRPRWLEEPGTGVVQLGGPWIQTGATRSPWRGGRGGRPDRGGRGGRFVGRRGRGGRSRAY